jgi:hypothetical protein
MEIEKLLGKKGAYIVTATVIPNEGSNFLHIEGPGGNMSSIEAFEAEGGFEDSRGRMVKAPKLITDWVDRNVEDWYEVADQMLENATK